MSLADDVRSSSTGKPYRFAVRLNSFRAVAGTSSGAALVRAAARVRGLTAVELNYPQHFVTQPRQELDEALAASGFRPTALNLRFEGRQFADGAFTSPDAETREAAIRIAQDAVAEARRFGAGHVVVWLADDGVDYPFQADHARLWAAALAAFARLAAFDPGVRVSVEPKPTDPRRFSLIRGTADALLLVGEVGAANLGVTLDVCHALMAGEHPPASAALALRAGRLFGVHLNDGYGRADDGLTAGSVNPVMTLELLWTLRRGAYDGTIYFDTFPVREDPVAECEANIATVRGMEATLDRLDEAALIEAQARHDALGARRVVDAALIPGPREVLTPDPSPRGHPARGRGEHGGGGFGGGAS